MRDIREDWHTPRETIQTARGPRMAVRCLSPGCDHASLMDPGPLFGTRRFWPASGRSERFRCQCGGREAMISYTVNTSQADGPISADAIRLWL